MKKTNPRLMMQATECLDFYRAYKQLYPKSSEKRVPILIPAITCASFSIELGVKALLKLQGAKLERNHEIKTLINELDNDTKDKILNPLQLNWDDFEYNYEKISNSFKEWRYIYEANNVKSINLKFLEGLAKSIVDIVSKKFNISIHIQAVYR